MLIPTSYRLRPLLAGFVGALVLSGVYFGIVSLAESPEHALQQFWADRLLVFPIMIGFGIQVGLYVLLKTGPAPMHMAAAGSTTAAGGGMSTAAMVACCAHHVADVLPLLGLTAAATFLANWRIPFMVVGLLTNLIGIAIMLRAWWKQRQMLASSLSYPVHGETWL